MMDNADSGATDLLFPVTLTGTYRAVLPRCRTLVRRAIRSGNWDAAMDGLELAPVDMLPGDLILRGPNPLVSGDNVHLFVVGRELDKLIPKDDRDRWFVSVRDLTLAGLDRFWFALACLGETACLPERTSHDPDRPLVSLRFLAKFLRWWPQFCRLDSRFSHGWEMPARWPSWALVAFALCRSAGVPLAQIDDVKRLHPMEAAAAMARWIEDRGISVPPRHMGGGDTTDL